MAVRLHPADTAQTADEVLVSVVEVLQQRALGSMATYSGEHGAHANTAFIAFDENLVGWFVSERATRHCRNIAEDPRVSATLFLDPPVYGEHLRGVQMWGVAREAGLDETHTAMAAYQGRFPTFAQDPAVRDRFLASEGPLAFYRFEVTSLKVIDEPRFGRRVYVSATVER